MPAYIFDPTGVNPANRISNEIISLTVANGVNAFLIRPDAGPFYGASMVIVGENGVALELNTDYYLSHRWGRATEIVGQEIYGTVTLLSTYAAGNYRLNYQTIGGEYVTAPLNAIQSGLIALDTSYAELDWSTLPISFPTIPHHEELTEFTGMSQIYRALHAIATAVKSPLQGIHYDDLVGAEMANVFGTVEPIIGLTESVALLQDSQGKLILDLITKLTPYLSKATQHTNLNHYSMPLFGGLVLKVGRHTITAGEQLPLIRFVKPYFLHQCIFANAVITNNLSSGPVRKDKIYIGKPSKTSVRSTIVYDTDGVTTGLRNIYYIAIGI